MIKENSLDINHSSVKKVINRKDFYSKQDKCVYNSIEGKKCKCIKLKNSLYCRWHQPENEKIISITPTPSSNEIENKNENSITENVNNDNLDFEIKLLKAYLHKLISSTPINKKIDPSDLRIQLQLIEQIRKLVHSLSIIESQSKIYNIVMKIINSMVMKIVELINKHSTDDNLKSILSSELMDLSRNENELMDLRMLLKQITPSKRF